MATTHKHDKPRPPITIRFEEGYHRAYCFLRLLAEYKLATSQTIAQVIENNRQRRFKAIHYWTWYDELEAKQQQMPK